MESCPWAGWAPPNLDWCEAELCAWIRNPANTWSNLAYMIVALPMWRAGGRGRLFAVAAMFVGLTSFIYHASATYFFQVFDFLGMFAFVALPLAFNATRLGWIRSTRERWVMLAVVALGCLLLVVARFFPFPIQLIVFAMILFVVGQEVVLSRRSPEPRRLFWISFALILSGAAFSSADLSRLMCDPHNHWWQGHANWHILGAGSLLALAFFYRSLDSAVETHDRREEEYG